MKKAILILFFLNWTYCFSQNEYEHWIVNYYEINFFCDSVSLNASSLNLGDFEGFATICNKNTGQSLFTSDGQQVWNSQLQQMPNGSDLGGGQENSQAALIVPQPGSNHIYYLFTTDDVYPGSHGLEYSIVDMDKDGGLGDVTVKNVFLDSSISKLTGVYNIDSNFFWVISYNRVNNNFMSFKVDSNGLDTIPVLSNSNFKITSIYQTKGFLKTSPNGLQIVNVFQAPPVIGLYDINKNSGNINLVTFLPAQGNNGQAFGASFSPDNSKVYITASDTLMGLNNSEVYQYDITSSDTNVIKSSRITIDSIYANARYVAMQMGPDGKIYVVREGFDSISVIDSPNLNGKSCQFIRNKLFIPVVNITNDLSNNIDGLYYFATPGSNINLSYSILCNAIDSFKINTARAYDYFKISFGDGKDTLLDSAQFTFTHQYDSAGTYTVKLNTATGCNIQDSVTISVTVDTAKCSAAISLVTMPSLIIPTLIYGAGSQTQWQIINLPLGSNSVTIYDELGRTLYKTTNYLNNYDMRNLPPAMYFYRLTLVTGQEYVGKIVLVK